MKKVPITTVIGSWLKADEKIAKVCECDDCLYHSDSAYRGYMLGFEDGVNSQIVDEGEVESMRLLTKQDIADAFNQFKSDSHFKIAVSESDCMKYISSSEQYWFFAGAMWLIRHMHEQNN